MYHEWHIASGEQWKEFCPSLLSTPYSVHSTQYTVLSREIASTVPRGSYATPGTRYDVPGSLFKQF